MIKRILLVLAVMALVSPMAFADVGVSNPADLVGIFEYNTDVGKDQGKYKGYGFTMDMGVGLEPGLGNEREYLLQGGGADVWGRADGMHMAYNLVSGDIRMSADIDWIIHGDNYWAKYGVMLRDPGADVTDGRNANLAMMTRRDEDRAIFGGRDAFDAGSWSNQGPAIDAAPITWGIQRITLGDYTIVQGLFDQNTGNGWEVRDMRINPALPDEVMAGVFLTSHDVDRMAQIKVTNVAYETEDIGFIGDLPNVDTDPIDQCSDVPGFKIRVRKFENDAWRQGLPDDAAAFQKGEDLMDGTIAPWVLDLDIAMAPPAGWNGLEGVRVDPVVNLNQAEDNPGAFQDDSHFPGIDLYKDKVAVSGFADDGDDDNDFAVEVIACIYLTEGAHIIGANGDDGTLIEIGGMEIGRTEAWKGASNRDFLFTVGQEGFYSLRALHIGGGGGENLELHEVLADGSRILLGATDENGAFIGSPVYAPEPATIALLGLGGLSLIRRKRS